MGGGGQEGSRRAPRTSGAAANANTDSSEEIDDSTGGPRKAVRQLPKAPKVQAAYLLLTAVPNLLLTQHLIYVAGRMEGPNACARAACAVHYAMPNLLRIYY